MYSGLAIFQKATLIGTPKPYNLLYIAVMISYILLIALVIIAGIRSRRYEYDDTHDRLEAYMRESDYTQSD